LALNVIKLSSNCRFNADVNAPHCRRLTWALGLSKYSLWKQVAAMSKSLENSIIARPRKLPSFALPAITPIGARDRSGSGNAITEPGQGRENRAQELQEVFPGQSLRRQPNRAFKGTPDISHRFGNSERGAP